MTTTQVNHMTDTELINYFEEHSKTLRAMFARDHIKRIWRLAGMPRPRGRFEKDFASVPYDARLQAILDIARDEVQRQQEVDNQASEEWDEPLY